MADKQSDKESSTPVRVAIVGAIATIIVAIITGIFALLQQKPSGQQSVQPTTTQVRANTSFDYFLTVKAKETGQPLPNAKVTIFVTGYAPLLEMTDSAGVAGIRIDADRLDQPARLTVEASEYEQYTQNVVLHAGSLPTILQLGRTATAMPTVVASPVPTATPLKARNPSCIYPLPRDQIPPTPVSSKLNPFVSITGYVQYADGPAIANAQLETDKGDVTATDSQGYFTTRVHSRPGVRLTITIPQDKFTFVVDAYSDIRVILCIPR